jgi:probable DNA repair protein
MGVPSAIEINAWLNEGGLVVTASERAARALTEAFHRARQAEGLSAWPAPNILDWMSFVRGAWEERTADGRLLLNPAQEQSLWEAIAGESRHMATLLAGPRHRLAAMAMEAHERLCAYAPRLLKNTARSSWQRDAAAFSAWLTAFDEACRAGNLLSPARLPLELIALLEDSSSPDERPPLLLAGFDRILPVQRSLFDAWGEWHEPDPGEPSRIHFEEASDAQAELAACALWCERQLAAQPRSRLLVVTQDATARRGEIERAFLKHTGSAQLPLFEFSLGIPLSQVALARGAHLLLRWLSGPLAEHELDWLLSTGQAAADAEESMALASSMRALRRRGLERTHWFLAAFISQSPDKMLPDAWVNRMMEAKNHLAEFAHRSQSPLDWAELVPRLLEAAGWPGARPLSSAEFQAAHRWQQAVETAGSLGFDGRRIPWREFLSVLTRTLDEILFVPESHDAPIQITGPAESAGLTADAVWFLGANEDSWPASGPTHPLLPPEVQREAGMPHATPQLDWDLAQAITTRLRTVAPEVHFSFACQNEGLETRPSRLIAQLAGSPQPLPTDLATQPAAPPLTVASGDSSRIPFPPGKAEGGSSVLTYQSQCPFKAFATARLAARGWERAQAGLTASQRGQLLHAVLHAVWGGPPEGIRTLKELENLGDRSAFVAAHVHRALQAEIRPGLRARMPQRYLELEEQRLTRLVREWLDYEATRLDFKVIETEVDRTIQPAGLTLKLRLDRIDRLNDNSLLVIDYKTGQVSTKSWDPPRPDDVQLPLYASFALDPDEELGGLVFAKVRPGDRAFEGRVGDAKATLLANLSGNSNLVKNSLTAEQLIDWRKSIEQLARDFVAGRAEVDPREAPKTCERCGLQTLCRIQEHQAPIETGDDSDGEEENDE